MAFVNVGFVTYTIVQPAQKKKPLNSNKLQTKAFSVLLDFFLKMQLSLSIYTNTYISYILGNLKYNLSPHTPEHKT